MTEKLRPYLFVTFMVFFAAIQSHCKQLIAVFLDVNPIKVDCKAVHVTGVLVTDDLTVTRIVNGVATTVDVTVTVKVFILGVSKTGLVVLCSTDQGVEIGLAGLLCICFGGINVSLALPESV